MMKNTLVMTTLAFLGCISVANAEQNKILVKSASLAALQNHVQRLNTPEQLALRCQPDNAFDKPIYSGDFRWGYSIDELILRFHEIYLSEKRLRKRMYWDHVKQSLYLPLSSSWGGSAATPVSFVESVRRHVEEALRLKYVDGIFFPDMGHSHFYVPADRWKEITDKPVSEFNKVYEGFFSEPTLKVLYHTAEQLRSLDSSGIPLSDRKTFWRFSSRNLLGDNLQRGHLEILQTEPGTLEYTANTIREILGYKEWGSGFNISASAKGCYAYLHQDEVRYFDLSLSDLEPELSFLRHR